MEHNKEIEDRYCHGQCYPMAIALHRKLGWPIRTLSALRFRGATMPHPAHSWVLAPDGRAFDASGFRSEADILDEFLANRQKVTIDSARIETSAGEEDYLKFILQLAGADQAFEDWYKSELARYVPEAEQAIVDYLEPRYSPSGLNSKVEESSARPFEVRYQPDGITCGPSCLGAVLDILVEGAPSTEEIADLCGTNPCTGTTDVAMKRGMEALGVSYLHPDPEERSKPGFLDAALDAGNIVLLRTMVGRSKHWVTAYAREDDGYAIACPVAGHVTWGRDQTMRAWGARDYDCMVLSREPADHPELLSGFSQEAYATAGPDF